MKIDLTPDEERMIVAKRLEKTLKIRPVDTPELISQLIELLLCINADVVHRVGSTRSHEPT